MFIHACDMGALWSAICKEVSACSKKQWQDHVTITREETLMTLLHVYQM